MTKAQQEVTTEQDLKDFTYKQREFRKKCVTQGIVSFVRPSGYYFYSVEYRGRFVATLFGDYTDKYKLMTMWNVVRIAEETIEKIEGVKHDC